jgi:NAD(P)-dependent dehydrogenase (short-subunit alcohol dehydrogenase family)
MHDHPVALVTGGSRGIGRGICVALAGSGHAVVVNFASNIDAAQETSRLVEQAGGRAEICQGDVAIGAHRELLLEFCMEQFGRLDVLVNNAGITSPDRGELLDLTEKGYDRLMDVNLKGPFFLTQAAAKLMIPLIERKAVPSACIVNVSSLSAHAVSATRGDYCVSKAGLSMMTSVFAARLAEHGIGVYEVRPGIVETDMTAVAHKKYEKLIKEGLTPIRRWGQPEDVGRAVTMLARGDLAFSTGEIINVDGGFHIRQL